MRIHSALDDIYAHTFVIEADDLGSPPATQPTLPTQETHDSKTCVHCQNNMSPASAEQRKKYNVPPGLKNVHASNDPESHMVARGEDAKGRVKSFYTPEFHEQQAQQKFNRVNALHEKIPELDQKLAQDAPNDPHAAAVALSRHMGLRPGSTKDTKADVQAYGASTLLAKNARIARGKAKLDFIGKEGKHLQLESDHPTVVSAVQAHLQGKKPSEQLFSGTSAAHMNNYLKNAVGPLNEKGDQPLVKDLRTYHANALALNEVNKHSHPPRNEAEFKKRRRDVANVVSSHLGNTPVMALSSYINPTVFDSWKTDPSWGEPGKKARFALGDQQFDDEEAKKIFNSLDPKIEKALVSNWLSSILWTHNEGDIHVDDPEGDADSQ